MVWEKHPNVTQRKEVLSWSHCLPSIIVKPPRMSKTSHPPQSLRNDSFSWMWPEYTQEVWQLWSIKMQEQPGSLIHHCPAESFYFVCCLFIYCSVLIQWAHIGYRTTLCQALGWAVEAQIKGHNFCLIVPHSPMEGPRAKAIAICSDQWQNEGTFHVSLNHPKERRKLHRGEST